MHKATAVALLIIANMIAVSCNNNQEFVGIDADTTRKITDTAATVIVQQCESQKEECRNLHVREVKHPPITDRDFEDNISEIWILNINYERRPKAETSTAWSSTSAWIKVKISNRRYMYAEQY